MKLESDSSLDQDQSIWRYMKTNRFMDLLENGSFYFASANEFDDRFEGAVSVQPHDWPVDPRYSEMEFGEGAFQQLKRLTKILCWHKESYESNAMWQLYSNEGKGIAIVTSPRKVADSITPYRIKPEYGEESLYGGNVKYVNLLQERLKVGMLERFYYKHLAFSWEKEFRLSISVRGAEEFGVNVPEKGIHVAAKMSQLIEHIFLGPKLADEEKEKIIEMCTKHNIAEKIKVSSMLGKPRYV